MPAKKHPKTTQKPEVARREPRQDRAHHKIGLMLEATTRLLEEGGLEAVTTNAIAERAGVSIGTLYQYFDDKDAILDALTKRELSGMGERVQAVLSSEPPPEHGGRVRALVGAILASYAGRRGAHRRLMERAMIRGSLRRVNPVFARLAELLTREGVAGPEGERVRMNPTEAFVITHAIAGVMRAAMSEGPAPPRAELEEALARLVVGFVAR